MKTQEIIKPTLPIMNSLLLLGVLLSFCLSNNVGLRLLPYPLISPVISLSPEIGQSGSIAHESLSQSGGVDLVSERVIIAAPGFKRTVGEQTLIKLVTLTTLALLPSPEVTADQPSFFYRKSPYITLPHVSQLMGRAPPSLT